MKKLLLIIIGLIFMVNNLTAQTFTVNPGNHSSWFDNASWVSGVSPGDMINPGQTVIIPSGSSINYDASQLTIIGTLQIDGTLGLPDSTSDIDVFGIMNITGTLIYNGLLTSLPDRIDNLGTINIDGGTFTQAESKSETVTFNNLNSGTLNIINGGRLAVDEEFIDFHLINDGTINNEGQIGRTHYFNNSGTFVNAGSLSVRPTSSPAISLIFQGLAVYTNSGTFINSGALNFDSFDAFPLNYESSITATNTGTFTNNAGGSILMRPRFNNGLDPVIFTNTANFTNNGTLTITRDGAKFENAPGGVMNNTTTGNILIENNAQLNTTAQLTNQGTINNDATMSVVDFGILDNESNGTVINNSNFINNGTLNSIGVFTNNGSLTNENVPSAPTVSGRINLGGTGFTNNGTIVNDFILESIGTITNSSMGTITNNSFLFNEGTIINQGNIAVLNDGLLTRTGISGLSNIENSGTITVNNASLSLRRTVLSNTGALILGGISETAAGRLFIEQETFSRLTNLPEGVITINFFGELHVSLGTLQNSGGIIDINSGGSLLVRGDFSNANNSGIFRNEIGVVENDGLIRAWDNGRIENFSLGATPGTSASILNNFRIILETKATLINRGNISNTASGLIFMTGDQFANLPNSGFSLQNNGAITIQRANATNSPTPFINGGDGLFTNNGNLNLTEGDSSNVGTLINTTSGFITINSLFQNGAQNQNAILFNEGTITTTNSFENVFGAIFENNGDFTSPGSFSNTDNAVLSGINSLHIGDLINDGIISPGSTNNSVGTYALNNDYTHTNNAILNIEIESLTTFDNVDIVSAANLNGTLNMSLINGFEPQSGDTFTILTAGAIFGTFDTVNLPALNAYRWEINYHPTSVTLTALANCDTLTFTAPEDLCINAGVQASLSGGLFDGGVYSGPGVTDDGNGMTYSFDPMIAGVGIHTLDYTFTNPSDAGCVITASDIIEVFALPIVTFTAPEDLCLNAGIQTDLSGGTPAVSILSTTVTLNINYDVFGFSGFVGGNIVFDSSGAMLSTDVTANNEAIGSTVNLVNATALGDTITLTFDNGQTPNIIAETAIIGTSGTINFISGTDFTIGGDLLNFISGEGTATTETVGSGIYAGPGVTNEASGTLYSFDPAVAGVGTHTITYTFTNENDCTVSASDTIEVFACPCSGGLTSWIDLGGGVLDWNNGAPDATMTAIIASDYNTSLGNITACELVIQNGASLTVEAETFVNVENDITVNGSLQVAHIGSVVQVDDAATVTGSGNVSVLVDTPNLDVLDFMIMGSPMDAETRENVWASAWNVQNYTPANFNPVEAVTDAYNFADAELDDWNLYTTGPLAAGEGFLVRPQTSLNGDGGIFSYNYNTGFLTNGVVTRPLNFNTEQLDSPNMLSNPYASAIDADLFLAANPEIDALYFWEHLLAPDPSFPGASETGPNYSMGDVSFYNAMGGIGSASGSTAPTNIISTAQGFGTFANAAGTATFNNSMRLTTGNTTLRAPEVNKNRLWLHITCDTYNVGGTTLVGFTEAATAGFDPKYDSQKMATHVSIFSHIETNDVGYVVQGRELFDPEMVIGIGFSTIIEEQTEYTISLQDFDGLAWETNIPYLVDVLTGVITNLNEASYSFTSDVGIFNHRFILQFENEEALNTNEALLTNISVVPNPTTGLLFITSPNTTIKNVSVVDLQGRLVQEVIKTNSNTMQVDISVLNNAVYFLHIETENGIIVKRVIKE